jgi:hypothetical protein
VGTADDDDMFQLQDFRLDVLRRGRYLVVPRYDVVGPGLHDDPFRLPMSSFLLTRLLRVDELPSLVYRALWYLFSRETSWELTSEI